MSSNGLVAISLQAGGKRAQSQDPGVTPREAVLDRLPH